MNKETKEQRNIETQKHTDRETSALARTKKQRNRETVSLFLCFSVSQLFDGSRDSRGGFTALITVLIVSAITIAAATTLIFLSTSESLFGFSANLSHETIQIADACAEEAFFRLKSNQTYSSGTITLGDGTCTIAITGSGGNGSSRAIIASSTISTAIGNFTRRIMASTTISTNTAGNATTTDITKWQE